MSDVLEAAREEDEEGTVEMKMERRTTEWYNIIKLIHIFNWIMKWKKIIHFSSALFELEWVPPKVVLAGWEEEKWSLYYWNWNENSVPSKRKWKMESFSICLCGERFFIHFFSLRVTPCWHSRRTKNHKLKTYWH